MSATLDRLRVGQSGRIAAVHGDAAIAQRVLALGLLPGATVRVVGVAPMGDPITVESSAGRISLRRAEAAAIQMIDSDHIHAADGAASA